MARSIRLASKIRGGFTRGLLALETSCGKKQVAAVESIFHKFIILQVLHAAKRGSSEPPGSKTPIEPSPGALHYFAYDHQHSGLGLDRERALHRQRPHPL